MYYKTDSYITNPEYLKTYNVFHFGDIAFEGNKNKNFAHGRFVENTIGNGIISHVFDVFRPKMKYEYLFWKYAINNERIMGRILLKCTKSSTMMTNLVAADFLKEQIFVPSLNEQKLIGNYIYKIDNLITLHQRKYDKLVNVKKAILEKMFPKDGADVPEIRFKGFTEAWEQRKLIDYLEVSSLKNKDEAYRKEDVLSVSGDCGIVNQIEFQGRSFAGVSVAPYGVVETGDIVYTKSPLKSNPYGIIKTNKEKPGIVSTLYAVYKPLDNVYSEFVQIYFEQNSRMNNYMHPLVNKGAKNDMKVSDKNALKGEVCFPNRDEQIKISGYFAKIDNLITLHQRKLLNLV